MDSIAVLIDQIPIRHNLVSSIMLLGIFQSFFISLVILYRAKKNYAIKYLGWSFLFSSIVFFDTYLCFTGLIKNVMYLNDASEPLVLLIFPFTYFSIYGLIKRTNITFRKHWWHLVLPFTYSITQIPFYMAPLSVKYNAYLGAYFPHFSAAEVPNHFNYGYHHIKDIFDWLILFSILLYSILSLRLVFIERQKKNETRTKSNKYIFTRNSSIVLVLLLIFIFVVFYNFDDDGGDHYIVFFQTIVAFATSYVVLSESRFFDKSWIADKYETLSNSQVALSMADIETYVNANSYFISKDASLKDLASLLKVHPNQISKIINQENSSNFNDFLNQKRLQVAKLRLTDPEYSNYTIEAIANSVGFKSKSTFYNAFKKHIGISPSDYIKSIAP